MIKTPLKLSVNRELIDKIAPTDKKSWSHGFEPHELTIEELAKTVSELGYAFSYVFEGGVRKTENFLGADFLAVDVDGAQTIEHALKNRWVSKYCSLLYTTASHKPESPRFRLVFVLPKTITDPNELKAASLSLARRCGGDLSATDAARMFYGAMYCRTILLGKKMNQLTLDSLISDGKVQITSDSIAHPSRKVTSRSLLRIPRDEVFTTDKNKQIKICQVVTKVSVFCPFHGDRHTSAFIAVSPNGGTFFRCSSCQMTRFMEGTENSYDFDSFEKAMQCLGGIDKKSPEKTAEYLLFKALSGHFNFNLGGFTKPSVQFTGNQYLKLGEIKPGITCIKSPKGSGKTHYLAQAVGPSLESQQWCKTMEQYEEADVEDDRPRYPGKTVLLIGHRQALIRDMCKRLRLQCYLDDPILERIDFDSGVTKYSAPSEIGLKRYGVCLDSLHRVGGNYDLVLIDESEQVLAHFLSDTIGEGRYILFEKFQWIIRSADSVIALDADLGWSTLNTLMAIRSKTDWTRYFTPPRWKIKYNKPHEHHVRVIINSWKPADREITAHPTANQVLDLLKTTILEGHRCFVVSNSKTRIKAVAESIALLEKAAKRKFRVITITAENSKTPAVQKFITQVKTEILKYDVILTSPSLGTGVDITFENGRQEVHSVFGIFENLINTHTEIDQQLGRVRNPKQVHVYVSGQTFNFETDLLVNERDYLEDNFNSRTYTGNTQFSEEPAIRRKNQIAPQSHPMLRMITQILSFQRASKNQLRKNFYTYKEKTGWKVTQVDYDETKSKNGTKFFKLGKKLNTKKEIEAVVNAKRFTYKQIKGITERMESNFATITQEERYGCWRDRIARFYASEVDTKLVKLDDKSRFREKLRNFEAVSSTEYIREAIRHAAKGYERKQFFNEREWIYDAVESSTLSPKELIYAAHRNTAEREQRMARQLIPSHGLKQILLYEILSHTVYFKRGRFDPGVTFKSEDCSKFVQFVKQQKKMIETHLGIAVPSDIDKKPIQMIFKIIKMVGLTHWRYKPRVINGKKTYTYRVCPNRLLQLRKMCQTRAKSWNTTIPGRASSKEFGKSGDLGSLVVWNEAPTL